MEVNMLVVEQPASGSRIRGYGELEECFVKVPGALA